MVNKVEDKYLSIDLSIYLTALCDLVVKLGLLLHSFSVAAIATTFNWTTLSLSGTEIPSVFPS